jgi:hypothetical protein
METPLVSCHCEECSDEAISWMVCKGMKYDNNGGIITGGGKGGKKNTYRL